MSRQRLKILIIAHEFSPLKGSESAVGWNLASRIAKYHDVTVLYASGSQYNHTSYVKMLNEYFKTAAPVPGLTCINVDRPFMSRFIARLNYPLRRISIIGLPALYYMGYSYWQKAAFKTAVELQRKEQFDVVHQLTQITFREPGFTWKLGIPFFWGPTGGTSTFPAAFKKEISLQSKILTSIRSVSGYLQFHFSRRVAQANKKAAVIYTFSEKDRDHFKKRASGVVKIMLDVGTYARSKKPLPSSRTPSAKLKGIWCGRLTDFKAPSILLRALARSEQTREGISFIMIGAGAQEQDLKQLAEELQLKNIEWLREISHERVFELMGEADFFVHTSIQEATSSVITEALTMGLPVICHDAYGMRIAVNDSCGFRVPFISPASSIKGFHEAMEKILNDRELLNDLKAGALKRSEEISWDVMAETISGDYLKIVNQLKNK